MVEAVANPKQPILEPLPAQVIKARQDLTKVLKAKTESKASLYDHIIKVVDRIVMSCPDRALERFEEISYLIKNSDCYKLEDFVKCCEERDYARPCDDIKQGTQEALAQLRKSLGTADVAADVDPEAEGGAGGAVIGLVQDLTSLNKHVFNQAGVELGEYSSLILQKSLKTLSSSSEARSLRFWGKIFGTQKDYYVVEAFETKNLPEDTRPEGGEARGQGVNEYNYFVSNSAQGPWTVLPDLQPEDLENARSINISFSGNLEREIVTNPFYFKQEKFFLRAQIARIHHCTKLVPVGRHRVAEREEKSELPFDVEPNQPEDAELPIPTPTTEQMCNKSSWVHYAKCILKNNKTSHTLNEEVEDREAEISKVLAMDPYETRLKSITDDKACKGSYPAWILRSYGDKMNYAMANPLHGMRQYNLVVVKSMVWPGAMSYFWQGQWGEIYVGDGLKHENVTYFPVQPPCIMDDPEEKPVCPEPNPQGESTPIDEILAKCVEDIWSEYDKDGNGYLDKEEARSFVVKTLADINAGPNDFSEEAYNECFATFDVDGSGQITKNEMCAFIKQVAGF